MSASKRDLISKCLFRRKNIRPFYCLYVLQTKWENSKITHYRNHRGERQSQTGQFEIQFSKLRTNCWSVFDHFVRLVVKGLNEDKILTHLDYSENHKCQHQNEILFQSAYFGEKTFGLFTACTYYKQNGKIQKLPITVTTEEKDNLK